MHFLGKIVFGVFAMQVLAVILVSCNNSESPCVPVKTSGPIVPLAIGNQWVYHITEFADGSVTRSYYDTLTIRRDTLINGEKWYFYYGGFWTNRSNGLWGVFQVTKDSVTPVLIYPYPTSVGTVIHLPSDSGFVFAVDTLISVPYGCFYTNVYFIGKDHNYSECFVPGIGEIKWEQWYGGFDHHEKIKQIELVSAIIH
jgi:hypothetical protein